MLSFVSSVSPTWNKSSLGFGTPALSSLRKQRVRQAVPRCVRWQALCATTSTGWSLTREELPTLKVDPDICSKDEEPLPGVHFTEPPALTTGDLLALVRQEAPDAWVNEITRTLLGWRQNADGGWDVSHVPFEWVNEYPDAPPDFIGSAEDFSPARDRPVKKAVQKLNRSVPAPYKQLLKEVLGPLGFKGWTVRELTPNRTRRATIANWVLYWYRVHYPEYEWK